MERYWRSTRGPGCGLLWSAFPSVARATKRKRRGRIEEFSLPCVGGVYSFTTTFQYKKCIILQDSVTHHIPTDTTTIYFKLLNRNTVPICTKDGLTNTIQSALDNEKFLVYYCHWHIQKPPTFTKFFFFTTSDTGTQSSLNSSCPYSLQRAARHSSASR